MIRNSHRKSVLTNESHPRDWYLHVLLVSPFYRLPVCVYVCVRVLCVLKERMEDFLQKQPMGHSHILLALTVC